MRLLIASIVVLLIMLLIPAQAQTAPQKPASSSNAPVMNSVGSSINLPGISVEEIYVLRKLKMQEELQNELVAWAQSRFWFIAVFTVLVGFFGVRALVREMLSTELKDATKASAEAAASAAQGREVVKEVRAEANKYKDEVLVASQALGELQRQLNELRSRIDAESVRIGAHIELKVDSLSKQIVELTESIANLTPATSISENEQSTTRERIEELRQAALTEDRSFEENSKYRITVVHHAAPSRTEPVAAEIVRRLSRQGFKASLGEWFDDHKDTESPVEIEYKHTATEIIRTIEAIVTDVLKDTKQSPTLQLQMGGVPKNDENDVRIFF